MYGTTWISPNFHIFFGIEKFKHQCLYWLHHCVEMKSISLFSFYAAVDLMGPKEKVEWLLVHIMLL